MVKLTIYIGVIQNIVKGRKREKWGLQPVIVWYGKASFKFHIYQKKIYEFGPRGLSQACNEILLLYSSIPTTTQ